MNSQAPNHLMSSVNTNSLHARRLWASSQAACSVLFSLAKKQEFPGKIRAWSLQGIWSSCSYWDLVQLGKQECPLQPPGPGPQCLGFARAPGLAQVSPCTHQQSAWCLGLVQGLQVLCQAGTLPVCRATHSWEWGFAAQRHLAQVSEQRPELC